MQPAQGAAQDLDGAVQGARRAGAAGEPLALAVPEPRRSPRRPRDGALPLSHAASPTPPLPRQPAKLPPTPIPTHGAQDDFYLNLVDWSSLNVLAVGLGTCVYLWSACTSKVTKLCDLGPEDSVRSGAHHAHHTHCDLARRGCTHAPVCPFSPSRHRRRVRFLGARR